MKIFKRTDRLNLKIDSVELKLSPLSLDQKSEIQQLMISGRAKGNIKEASRGLALALKYSIKNIKGISQSDGTEYKLETDSEGNLTDECIDDLLNLEITKKLTMVCAGLVNGIPSQFTDENGEKIEGVEFIKSEESHSPN